MIIFIYSTGLQDGSLKNKKNNSTEIPNKIFFEDSGSSSSGLKNDGNLLNSFSSPFGVNLSKNSSVKNQNYKDEKYFNNSIKNEDNNDVDNNEIEIGKKNKAGKSNKDTKKTQKKNNISKNKENENPDNKLAGEKMQFDSSDFLSDDKLRNIGNNGFTRGGEKASSGQLSFSESSFTGSTGSVGGFEGETKPLRRRKKLNESEVSPHVQVNQ
jgi:hypothetical protein